MRYLGPVLLFLAGIICAIATANAWFAVPSWCIFLCFVLGVLMM